MALLKLVLSNLATRRARTALTVAAVAFSVSLVVAVTSGYRQYRDEVERYELVSGGREVVMELFGPVGSDNVDAYRTMIHSLRLS